MSPINFIALQISIIAYALIRCCLRAFLNCKRAKQISSDGIKT